MIYPYLGPDHKKIFWKSTAVIGDERLSQGGPPVERSNTMDYYSGLVINEQKILFILLSSVYTARKHQYLRAL